MERRHILQAGSFSPRPRPKGESSSISTAPITLLAPSPTSPPALSLPPRMSSPCASRRVSVTNRRPGRTHDPRPAPACVPFSQIKCRNLASFRDSRIWHEWNALVTRTSSFPGCIGTRMCSSLRENLSCPLTRRNLGRSRDVVDSLRRTRRLLSPFATQADPGPRGDDVEPVTTPGRPIADPPGAVGIQTGWSGLDDRVELLPGPSPARRLHERQGITRTCHCPSMRQVNKRELTIPGDGLDCTPIDPRIRGDGDRSPHRENLLGAEEPQLAPRVGADRPRP